MRQFLLYAVIRLGLWALIWWLLTLLDVGVMLAGVLAALIAMLLSILFLERLRDGAAMRWKGAHERRVERRGVQVDEDAEYEDSLLDAAGTDPEEPAGPAQQLPDLEDPDDASGDVGGESTGDVRGEDR
ncbi:MAG: DUF4229 domain-containing protein [Brachybacterium sp.]|uniref:DUF4229 domain-containing protein n=1 Tax=unclassified Brachybacterium TaxID=2623841 RepID=UPI003F9C09A5